MVNLFIFYFLGWLYVTSFVIVRGSRYVKREHAAHPNHRTKSLMKTRYRDRVQYLSAAAFLLSVHAHARRLSCSEDDPICAIVNIEYSPTVVRATHFHAALFLSRHMMMIFIPPISALDCNASRAHPSWLSAQCKRDAKKKNMRWYQR